MIKILLRLPIYLLWHFKIKRKLSRDQALKDQEKILKELYQTAQSTEFGKEHSFEKINHYNHVKKYIPIREYKEFKKYWEKILAGKENILWPTSYQYLLATSKSTADVEDKFVPISKEGLKSLVKISFNMLINYAYKTKNEDILFKRGLYVGASPKLKQKGKYPHGLLSGVSYYLKPKLLRNFGLPSFKTNAIDDWEEKIKKIEEEIYPKDLGIIVGTPPWVNILIDNLYKRTQKPLNKHFNSLILFMFGGAPLKLYKKEIQKTLGKDVYILENYPASEGFIGFQDQFPTQGQLLQTSFGTFYEFIKKEDYYKDQLDNRICLKDVKVDQEYALILHTNSGLFGYILGDIIKFRQINPFRFEICGRLRHFIKYENRYLNDHELSTPLSSLIQEHDLPIKEFTFAPATNKDVDLYYESSDKLSKTQESLIKEKLEIKLNFYPIKANSIYLYMKENFRIGGQYKITRIRNDRKIVDFLDQYLI